MGFGVWGLGFGVWGLGFGVWGLGFRAWNNTTALTLATSKKRYQPLLLGLGLQGGRGLGRIGSQLMSCVFVAWWLGSGFRV